MSDEILTTKQMAEEYPWISPGTLRYLRSQDKGPRSFRVGRRVLYRRADVEEWISSQSEGTHRGGIADATA